MWKDTIGLLVIFLAGLMYMFYSFTDIHLYPYFMTATFVLFLSIGMFFSFLPGMTKKWFVRLIVVNSIVVILIPVLEGINWLPFTILYLLLIGFIFIGYSLYQGKKHEKQ